MNDEQLHRWLTGLLGRAPRDFDLFRRALTHSSRGSGNYERLEFLGDRVLGLVTADRLYAAFPDEPEGNLSRRLNALVARETCAEVARALDVPSFVRLGRQAQDDGAAQSDNVLGDVMEALIGALYLEAGYDAAAAMIERAWGERLSSQEKAPQHPKSALQEWAAANNRATPVYSVVSRGGPPHAPRFIVAVAIHAVGEARAEGSSKQEAETAAARALLEEIE